MMKKHWNRKGFTLAEVLIVVAIIVVLAGVGFIGLLSHMRNMQQLELDGHAKELFVAAQNHLALADSQGFLGKTVKDESGNDTGVFGAIEDETNGIFYFVVNAEVFNTEAAGYNTIQYNNPNNKESVLNQILPMASADESARTGGSYIIRYQKYPAKILDVFYVSTSGRFSLEGGLTGNDYSGDSGLNVMSFRDDTEHDNKKARRDSFNSGKSILGYYGGEAAASLEKGYELKAPSVRIINDEKLQIRVAFNNPAGTTDDKDKNSLTLMVTGESPAHSYPFELIKNGSSPTISGVTIDSETGEYVINLDDITQPKAHFSYILGSNSTLASEERFTNGENITVVAKAFNNNVSTNIAESGENTTNSLFDNYDKNSNTVYISNARHLENLETSISSVGVSYTTVFQKSDLDWNEFIANINSKYLKIEDVDDYQSIHIYTSETSEVDGDNWFVPVSLSGKTYTGLYNGQRHRISNIKVNAAGPAGVFSSVSNCTVSNLELLDFDITSTGESATDANDSMAGALAGYVNGSTVTSVLVRNSKNDGGDKALAIRANYNSGVAGGLVGMLSGTTINTSAAAVYVSAAGDAGGLIGLASGAVTVESSYSGGHTEKAKYESLTPIGTKTVVNVQSDTGHAGGLIGHASGTSLTINHSYSTASASSNATTDTTGIGGLVGKTESTTNTIKNCYAVGLVTARTGSSAKISPFVAIGTLTSSSTPNWYLTSVSPMINTEPLSTNVTAVSAGETTSELIKEESERQDAVTYDATLTLNYKGKFYFPTVEQLNGTKVEGITDRHFGDWQILQMIPLNYMLINGDTLDLKIELRGGTNPTKLITLAVTGNSSTYKATVDGTENTYNITRILQLGVDWDEATGMPSGITLKKIGAVEKDQTITVADPSDELKAVFAARFDASKTISATRKQDSSDTTGEPVCDVIISLDDITSENGHFAQLFCGNVTADGEAQDLIPGENITVRLCEGDGASWSELNTICKFKKDLEPEEQQAIAQYASTNHLPEEYNYCACADNSLFASSINADLSNLAAMSGANIVKLRHLQNLDSNTSYVNQVNTAAESVTSATLNFEGSKLDWDEVKADYASIFNYTGEYKAEAEDAEHNKYSVFNGIYNPLLQSLNGNNNTIDNLVITGTSGNYSKIGGASFGNDNAGLFRYVTGNLTITNLQLDNIIVSGTDNAAAVVASNSSGTVTLTNVKVNTPTISGSNAGSVVGSAGGAVNMTNVLVDRPVITGSGNVGGVVGSSSENLTLKTVLAKGEKDYHVTSTGNDGAAGGLVGAVEGNKTVVIDNSAAVLLVDAVGPAGGLIGKQNGGDLTVFACYVGGHTVDGSYSNSLWNIVSTSDTAAAGGLIGEIVASSITRIEKSFNTASVYSGAAQGAGGIVGKASGTFNTVSTSYSSASGAAATGSVLDLVYTVAPVNVVGEWEYDNENLQVIDGDSTHPGTAGNGAVFGNLGTGLTNSKLFYLADIYPDAKYEKDYTKSTIKYIGTGGGAAVKLATYFADKDTDGAYVGDGAEIIGVAHTSVLEQDTTAYDEELQVLGKEYPFSIWTKLPNEENESILHFYGDWEPVDRNRTEVFQFYFLMQDPLDEFKYVPIGDETWFYKLAVKMIPFEEAELPLPAVPYIPGFEHGNFDPTDTTQTGSYFVWSIYYGDCATESLGTTSLNGTLWKNLAADTKYNEEYDYEPESILLDETTLTTALDADGTNGYESTFTLVARYYDPGNQHLLTLMDVEDPASTTPDYSRYGSVQVIDDTEYETLKAAFDAGALFVPRRSKTIVDDEGKTVHYRFLGWYDSAAETANKVFGVDEDDGHIVWSGPSDGMPLVVDGELVHPTLYAHYERIESTSIKVLFYLEDETETDPNKRIKKLDVEYELEFEVKYGLEQKIALPGSNVEGKSVSKKNRGSDTEIPISLTGANAEASFTDDGCVLLRTGIHAASEYPAEYIVTLKGSLKQVAYAVVHVMEHTKADGSRDFSDKAYYIEECKYDTILEGQVPAASSVTEKVFAGFYTSDVHMYEPEKNFDPDDYYGVTNTYKPNANDETGYEVKYIIVVTYDRDQHMLSFEQTGESYYAPRYVYYGESIYQHMSHDKMLDGQENAPVYAGYALTGWKCKKTADNTPVTFGESLSMGNDDLTVYAEWVEQPVRFTLLVWLENANDDGWSLGYYDDSETLTAAIGTRITLEGLTDSDKATFTLKAGNTTIRSYNLRSSTGANGIVDPEGLAGRFDYIRNHIGHFTDSAVRTEITSSASSTDTNATVARDGSTLVNLYFKRNVYTLRFFLGKGYESSETTPGYKALSGDSLAAYTGTVYGRKGITYGDYFPLNKYSYRGSTFYGNSKPLSSVNEDEIDENYYGLIGGQVYPLTVGGVAGYVAKYKYATPPAANADRVYGLVDVDGEEYGEYREITLKNVYHRISGDDAYTYTEAEAGEHLVGIVGGNFVPLTPGKGYSLTGEYRYKEDEAGKFGIKAGAIGELTETYDRLGGYRYKQNDADGSYGIRSGEIKELTSAVNLKAGYRYQEYDGTTDTGNIYGIDGGAIEKLTGGRAQQGTIRYKADTEGTYGIRNGVIGGLKVSGTAYYLSGQYRYQEYTGTDATDVYGLVDGEFSKLSRSGSKWKDANNVNYRETAYKRSDNPYNDRYTGTDIYVRGNGQFDLVSGAVPTGTTLYGLQGGYYYELEARAGSVTWNDDSAYEGTRYAGESYTPSGYYTGDTFVVGTSSFASGTSGTLYGQDAEGCFFEVSGTLTWLLNGTAYNGTRYERSNNSSTASYTGTTYYIAGTGSFEEAATGAPLYGLDNGYFYELAASLTWEDGSEYTGTRYDREGSASSGTYDGDVWYAWNDVFTETEPTGYTGALLLYGQDADGYFFRISDTPTVKFNGEPYNGVRYERSGNDSSASYTGDSYFVVGERSFEEVSADDPGTLYGLDGGYYYELSAADVWKYGDEVYDRTKYTVGSADDSEDLFTETDNVYVVGEEGFEISASGASLFVKVGKTYYPIESQEKWVYTDGNSIVAYDGDRYSRSNDGATNVTEDDSLNAAGLYYVDSNGGKVEVDELTGDGLWCNGAPFTGNDKTVVVKYNGPFYKADTVNKGVYKVSTSNGKEAWSTYAQSNNGNWLQISNSLNPFEGVYTATDTFYYSIDGHYHDVTNYYYTITAKYEEEIGRLWPAIDWMDQSSIGLGGPFGSNYLFNTWGRPESSGSNIKGPYETMTTDLINSANRTFQGRYENGASNFVYSMHFQGNPSMDRRVSVRSAGNIDRATVTVFTGYENYDIDYHTTQTSRRPTRADDPDPYLIDFYYRPKNKTINLYDNEYAYQAYIATVNINYGVSVEDKLAEYTRAQKNEAEDAGYNWDGWYEDPFYTDKFDLNTTMPDSDLRLYAHWTHDDVTVTFHADGGTHGAGNAVTGGIFADGSTSKSETLKHSTQMAVVEEGTLKDAYVPRLDGYTFLYWYSLGEGDEEERYVLTQKVMDSVDLYPKWEPDQSTTERQITIHYYEVMFSRTENKYVYVLDSDNKPHKIREDVTATLRRADGTLLLETEAGALTVKDGDKVTMAAPDITDYTKIDPSYTIYRVSEENDEITFRYEATNWTYAVEYWVQYTSIAGSSWLTGFTAGESKSFMVHRDDSVPGKYRNELFQYTRPDHEELAYLDKYSFDHYEYGSSDDPIYDNYIFISPEQGRVVKVFLTPNVEEINVEDIVKYYDGSNKADHQANASFGCPSGYTAKVNYLYYDASGEPINGDIKDAGTYGVRAYVTVTDPDNKSYLLWKSEDSGQPPLHLYIQRRFVILRSRTMSPDDDDYADYYVGGVLKCEEVYQNIHSTNAKELQILKDLYETVEYYDEVNGFSDGAGFAPGEGVDIEFSINAFRRMSGTTSNVFTYRLKSNTKASNYNIYIIYGTLTVD